MSPVRSFYGRIKWHGIRFHVGVIVSRHSGCGLTLKGRLLGVIRTKQELDAGNSRGMRCNNGKCLLQILLMRQNEKLYS